MGWNRWVVVGMLLGIGCAGPPRYVRGDLQSTALALVPARTGVGLKPALVANPVDVAITERITAALEQSKHPVVGVHEAALLIGYRHTTSGRANSRYESDGFEAIWPRLEPLVCPKRFSQRLSIAITRAEAGRPTHLLWVGELCSDGGGQPAEVYVGTFAGEILRSLGMNRTAKRFEFLVVDPATAAAVAPTVAPPVEPRLPEAEVAASPMAPQSAVTSPQPRLAPDGAPFPGPEPTTPVAVTAPPVPMLAPPLPSESADELTAPGPTWSAVAEPCSQLDQQPEVACTLLVEIASGRPVLQIGYPSDDLLQSQSARHAENVGPIFCRTADAHGLLDAAVVRLRSPAGTTERDCTFLTR